MRRFNYSIQSTEGVWSVVSGYRLSRNFAARREWDGKWLLTHLPTGFAIYYCITNTRKELLSLARRIERLWDWSAKKSGDEIPMCHKYAVVRMAKGKQYANRWLTNERRAVAAKRSKAKRAKTTAA